MRTHTHKHTFPSKTKLSSPLSTAFHWSHSHVFNDFSLLLLHPPFLPSFFLSLSLSPSLPSTHTRSHILGVFLKWGRGGKLCSWEKDGRRQCWKVKRWWYCRWLVLAIRGCYCTTHTLTPTYTQEHISKLVWRMQPCSFFSVFTWSRHMQPYSLPTSRVCVVGCLGGFLIQAKHIKVSLDISTDA